MSGIESLDLILFCVAGAALGGLYFALLRRSLALSAGRSLAGVFVLFLALRIALAVAGFWIIAQQGAAPLLAALAGFLAVRFALQRRTLPE